MRSIVRLRQTILTINQIQCRVCISLYEIQRIIGVSPGYIAIVATPLTLITFLVRSLRTSMMTIDNRLADESSPSNVHIYIYVYIRFFFFFFHLLSSLFHSSYIILLSISCVSFLFTYSTSISGISVLPPPPSSSSVSLCVQVHLTVVHTSATDGMHIGIHTRVPASVPRNR